MHENIQNEQFWKDCEKGNLVAVQEAIRRKTVDLNWCRKGSPYLVCYINFVKIECIMFIIMWAYFACVFTQLNLYW